MIESTVEPKFVERRRQVRADARRTRVRRWIALGGFALVVAASIGALLSPLLDVDKVNVGGAGHLSENAVVEASGVTRGDHLVSVDLSGVRAKLLANPWIASAKVARKFPGTIDVRIIEEQPLLELTASDGVLLISTTGRVLAVARPGASVTPAPTDDRTPADLLTVDYEGSLWKATGVKPGGGVEALVGERIKGVATDLGVLVKRLPADLRAQVQGVQAAADGNVTLKLVDGADVKLGQPTEVEAKILATRAVLSQVVLDCLKVIDVREPTRAAVSRGPGCPGISPDPPQVDDDTSGRGNEGSEEGSTGAGQSGESSDSAGTTSSQKSDSGG